jgi:hypothetical protein
MKKGSKADHEQEDEEGGVPLQVKAQNDVVKLHHMRADIAPEVSKVISLYAFVIVVYKHERKCIANSVSLSPLGN